MLFVMLAVVMKFHNTGISASSDENCIDSSSFNTDDVYVQRSWDDNSYNDYCVDYLVNKDNYQDARQIREDARSYLPGYTEFWGEIYGQIIYADKIAVHKLADSLRVIQHSKTYSREEFADVVVTMVQNIPYTLVLGSRRCEDYPEMERCIDGEEFGFLSPSEFLATLQGDCDTRCLLLYSLLQEFGYDCKIAISLAYQHAMLLIDIPSPGSHIRDAGRNYYFWETTGTGWRSGEMPPKVSDISNWEIAL